MPDYKSMYFHLAGRMAGAIDALEAIAEEMKLSLQATEEMFISSSDEEDLDSPDNVSE